MENKGTLTQIIGPVVDVVFKNELPKIYNALKVKVGDRELVLEVAQHMGNNVVRTVAMDDTNGLQRGMEVIDRSTYNGSCWKSCFRKNPKCIGTAC